MARPKVQIDDEQLKNLMRLNPTDRDTALILGIHKDTLHKYIKSKYKKTFGEFREEYMAFTRFNLVKMALKKAMEGNPPLLIFCLKHFCGWSETGPQKDTEDNTIKWVYEDQIQEKQAPDSI